MSPQNKHDAGGPAPKPLMETFKWIIPYRTQMDNKSSLALTAYPYPSPTRVEFPTIVIKDNKIGGRIDGITAIGRTLTKGGEAEVWGDESISFSTDGFLYIGGSAHSTNELGATITQYLDQPTSSISPTLSPKVSTLLPQPGEVISTLSPTSTTPAFKSSRPGLDSGAVAGVAIGCIFAGATITGLLLWLLCARSRKKFQIRRSGKSSSTLVRNEKGHTSNEVLFKGGTQVSNDVDNELSQPLEDQAISGEISKIANLIKNHVQSFYHNGRVSPGLLDLDDLQSLGDGLPISTGTLSTMIGNSQTREIALRFAIAWVIISRIRFDRESSHSFLPPEVAIFSRSLASGQDSEARNLVLSKWKVITAELMQSSYGHSSFFPADPRYRNVLQAADILDHVLRPYSDSRINETQRRRNLEEILKRAAAFAFTLFSQPGIWVYEWQDGGGFHTGNLCIFPALVQTANQYGPRSLSEAVVRRLDV